MVSSIRKESTMLNEKNALPLPGALPEPGFYYHYKHDPDFRKPGVKDAHIRNYAYRILGSIGFYTEDNGPEDKYRVNYLPLYPWAPVYVAGLELGRIVEDNRPLSMFMEKVPKGTNGEMIPRFTKITDTDLIARLTELEDEQYSVFSPR